MSGTAEVWTQGTKQPLNLNPEHPDLRSGSVPRFIEQERLGARLTGARQAAVLVHPGGHGSIADLVTLQRDLLEQGFRVRIDGKGSYSPRE